MKKQKLFLWVEKYLFDPSFCEKILSFILLPLSFIYCLVVITKRTLAKKERFNTPIISVGNLIVGGSGKTPFSITLAKRYNNVFIILRGYKRESAGLIIVSKDGKILTDIKASGDEAMLLAQSLPNSSVIVSEDRKKAILEAIKLGAEIIILDDGFSKSNIEKFDILIQPKERFKNNFCLPSGPYREPKSYYKKANLVLKEDKNFKRVVKIDNENSNMVLVTAISKPKRLDKYLPKNIVDKYYFEDHYSFSKQELINILKNTKANSILTTQKDAVKMENFDLNLSIMKLELEIDSDTIKKIDNFLYDFGIIPKDI